MAFDLFSKIDDQNLSYTGRIYSPEELKALYDKRIETLETRVTTIERACIGSWMDNCLFACQWTTGAEGQQWNRLRGRSLPTGGYEYTIVDNPTDGGEGYFNDHPVYSGIEEVQEDNQYFIKIPKVYVRREIVNSDNSPFAWADVRAVSSTPAYGFELHPAFYRNGQEIPYILIGKYQLSQRGSVPNVSPKNGAFLTLKTACAAFGDGYHMWNIHELSLIQLLYLIEYCHTDSQTKIGVGKGTPSSSQKVDAPVVAAASYRGLVGLWGALWQGCDGMTIVNDEYYVADTSQNLINTGIPTNYNRTSNPHVYPASYQNKCYFSNDFNVKYLFFNNEVFSDGENPAIAAYPDLQAYDDTGFNTTEIFYFNAGGIYVQNNADIGIFYHYFIKNGSYGSQCGARLAKYPTE